MLDRGERLCLMLQLFTSGGMVTSNHGTGGWVWNVAKNNWAADLSFRGVLPGGCVCNFV